MAHFFIDRPIFAWVVAIVIMLAGALSILRLPVAQYPSIAPPTIAINATYPGASAKTVEDSVTQIIEQKMTGLDRLLYMSSQSDSYGRATITLTFDAGTDPDIAQVQAQNKLQLALPLLPLAVQQQGVQVAKSARNFLMVLGFVSGNGKLTRDDLADFLKKYTYIHIDEDIVQANPAVSRCLGGITFHKKRRYKKRKEMFIEQYELYTIIEP
mgnify:CR=1 FL=1